MNRPTDYNPEYESLVAEDQINPNWPTPDDAARAINQMGPIALKMDPQQGLELVGLIQLAMRHPAMEEDHIADTAVKVVQAIREGFAASPPLQMVIDAGWINTEPEETPVVEEEPPEFTPPRPRRRNQGERHRDRNPQEVVKPRSKKNG